MLLADEREPLERVNRPVAPQHRRREQPELLARQAARHLHEAREGGDALEGLREPLDHRGLQLLGLLVEQAPLRLLPPHEQVGREEDRRGHRDARDEEVAAADRGAPQHEGGAEALDRKPAGGRPRARPSSARPGRHRLTRPHAARGPFTGLLRPGTPAITRPRRTGLRPNRRRRSRRAIPRARSASLILPDPRKAST